MTGEVEVSLAASLAASARRGPGLPAVTDATGSLSYGELHARALQLAAGLRSQGVRPGDRVGYLGKNSVALLEVLFATSCLGGVFVPLNWRLAPAELEDVVLDAGLHSLFLDNASSDAVTERSRQSCREVHVGVPAGLFAAGALARHERVAADQAALLMYTSGTTGRPKGVVLTHGNLWWNAVNVLLALDFRHDDVSLVVAPMFHIGGLNMTTLLTLQKGGHVVVHAGFEPAAVLEEIERSRVTSIFAVPAMLSALQQEPGWLTRDLSSLRMVVCGGAPVPPPLLRDYLERGVTVLQGYGMTETAPAITLLAGSQALDKLGSAGTPVPFTEVRLARRDGGTVQAAGERGEICVRGPNVTPGYWAQPAATAAAIDAEGWLHTGDIGYLDDDGCLYVVDRLKDMVISGGENVYPAEVEAVLHAHPAVRDVAVIGLPDVRWGEAVTAVVVPANGQSPDLEEIRSFASGRLARYKLPLRLELVEQLPRNPAGKVRKDQLRAALAPREEGVC